MAKKIKTPEPLLNTPEDQLSHDEHFKINSKGVVGPLPERYRDHDTPDLEKESEFLSKSHGLYLEYNRAQTGTEKNWMYMVRASIPGGGAFTAEQWRVFDSLADKYCANNPYGGPSIRLTTRQNIQYHWLKKPEVMSLVQDVASTGFYTLNGCGDVVRNVMGCPLSKFSDIAGANAFELAHQYGEYFRLPAAPHIQVFAVDPDYIKDPAQQYTYGKKLLNRKFKIAFSAVHRNHDTGRLEHDNCVELRTNEVGVAPVVEGEKIVGYHVYIGGGQGEKKGKPTFAAHGLPFGVFTPDNLMHGLKSIVDVHKQWGDRKNRVWARMKYVVWKQGIDWFRNEVKQLGADFSLPDPGFDPGPREMHHGWTRQASNGKWAYGAYVECGRLTDGAYIQKEGGDSQGNGQLKSMVPATLEKFPGVEVMITPNQDLLFTNIDEDAKEDFVAKLAEFGHGTRRGKTYSKLRVLSGACVGLPTCRLSYTDSEQFEPELMDQLEDRGYGDMAESIGITGCERQCFRPATKTFGWVGTGGDNYALKLGGSESARTQGHYLTDGEKQYLSSVPRDRVADVVATLFDWYNANKLPGGADGLAPAAACVTSGGMSAGVAAGASPSAEKLGPFIHRMGYPATIAVLQQDERTADLMQKRNPAMGFDPYIEKELVDA